MSIQDQSQTRSVRVLVTGANGFVGKAVCSKLNQSGVAVRSAVRTRSGRQGQNNTDEAIVEDMGPDTDWTGCLNDVSTVIHLAARVHLMSDPSANPLTEYRRVNVEGTNRLALMAVANKVRRFVFVSSIKVNGEETGDQPFTEEDAPNPQDPYGRSKWEAEQLLRNISAETGLEVVIVRPPLVYGPGVKANFFRLMRWVYSGLPIPLAGINNRRSMIGVNNLADLLACCATAQAAANQTLLVNDGRDLSTPELLRCIGTALHRRARLVAVPEIAMRAFATLFGFDHEFQRLVGSLTVNSQKARQLLSWTPPFSVEDSIGEAARWFLDSRGIQS